MKGIMPEASCEAIASVLEYPKGSGTKQVALQTGLVPAPSLSGVVMVGQSWP